MRAPHNRRLDPRTLGQRGEPSGIPGLFPDAPKVPARTALDVPEDWDEDEMLPPVTRGARKP
jgi:hypothetical protein